MLCTCGSETCGNLHLSKTVSYVSLLAPTAMHHFCTCIKDACAREAARVHHHLTSARFTTRRWSKPTAAPPHRCTFVHRRYWNVMRSWETNWRRADLKLNGVELHECISLPHLRTLHYRRCTTPLHSFFFFEVIWSGPYVACVPPLNAK